MMQKILSVALILLNGILGYLINQLPEKDKLLSGDISDGFVVGLTGLCLLSIIGLTLMTDSSPSPATRNNWSWLSSLTPFFGALFLYILLRLGQIPPAFSQLVFYASLCLFVLGVLLPVLLEAGKSWQSHRSKILSFSYKAFIVLGILATVYWIVKTRWEMFFLSLFVTIIISLSPILSSFINRLLQRFQSRINPDLENQLTRWTEDIIDRVESLVWKITSKFEGKYYHNLINKYSSYKIDGSQISFVTLALKDVYISLQVVAESAEKISGSMLEKPTEAKGNDIWHFLQEASKNSTTYRCLAIIGAPGSGKTTLLKYLTLSFADNTYRDHRVPRYIPIFLSLRDLREKIVGDNPPDLTALIEEEIRRIPAKPPLSPPPDWVDKQLKNQCLVLLDGLDEVAAESERIRVSQWVNAQMKANELTTFILTSRPYGYTPIDQDGNTPIDQVKITLKVLPFTVEQVKDFVHKWYLHTEIRSQAKDNPAVRATAAEEAEKLIEEIIQNRGIADLASNPLLVTMITNVHRCHQALPEGRIGLYERICDLLLGSRQAAKEIPMSLTAKQNKSILQLLALALMEEKPQIFTLEAGEKIIKEELETISKNKITPANFIKTEISRISGLLTERQIGIYEFVHRSFQEYLASVQIKELQRENLLIDNLDNPSWQQTSRFYAAQNDTTRLIQAVLKNPTVNSLTLAYYCQKEGFKVDRRVEQQLDDILEGGLDSDDPNLAKLAAEVKLSRRLGNLFRIDGIKSIDRAYLSRIEYQVFLSERLGTSFQCRDPRIAQTSVEIEEVLDFCAWLTSRTLPPQITKDTDLVYYRLPTIEEDRQYPVRERENLQSWIAGENLASEKGIRVMRSDLSHRYEALINYLIAGEWTKADRATSNLLFDRSTSLDSFSCQELQTIDALWWCYSKGRYSLVGQVSILQRLGGKALSLPRLNNSEEAFQYLAKQFREGGIEREGLRQFSAETVTVNRRGEIVKRETHRVRYFQENLGKEIDLEMVYIPSGKFWMGTEPDEIERLTKKYNNNDWFKRASPRHEVSVPSFFLSQSPITQDQWKAIASLDKIEMDLNPNPSKFKGDKRPVDSVNWKMAVEYCKRLAKLTGRQYRLPSEAEWEYACRAGTDSPFHYGETLTPELANYNGNYLYAEEAEGIYRKETTEVKKFPPNAFGLYDMHGNLWEWCEDDWHENYRNAPENGTAWIENENRSQNLKCLRGGSWYNSPVNCRSAVRYWVDPVDDYDNVGFRVACAGA